MQGRPAGAGINGKARLMKSPLRYQISDYDCGPTSMLNAVSFLFEREQIPPELIRNMQVDRAVTMLETGTKTVTEIAAECGFSSLRSFNRVFYEAMGETPTQCRRRVRNEERK